MNDSSFSFSSNIFGFVTGSISLLSFVVAVSRTYLPSVRIKTLEILLQETENSFKESVEAELLVPEFIERTQLRLTGLRDETYALRVRTYKATTLCEDFSEIFRGTSNAIERTCRSVKVLRAEIVTCNEERRRTMMQTKPASQALSPGPRPHSKAERPQPFVPQPPAAVRRPNSCPPTLAMWRPRDIDSFVECDPFSDASQSDPDVRTANVHV